MAGPSFGWLPKTMAVAGVTLFGLKSQKQPVSLFAGVTIGFVDICWDE